MNAEVFFHPAPVHQSRVIRPFFLPFGGCPSRCIYCSQHLQTGENASDLQQKYSLLEDQLEKALATGCSPFELGFFGGTFTSLPSPWPKNFLSLADRYRQAGLITRIRASTRPDAIDGDKIGRLRDWGLDMLELGIQSFSSRVLRASFRGYSGEQAYESCLRLKHSGIDLGIQLLPGLPEHTPADLDCDVDIACSVNPVAVRIYPCLVLDSTPLARMWRNGEYRPWSLEDTVSALSRALAALWLENIQVIRMGLSPEPSLLESILDGPWHPALGYLARSRFLLDFIQLKIEQGPKGERHLFVPQRFQSELWGHKGGNRPLLGRMGLPADRITPWKQSFFLLQSDEAG
ncbi:MAG: elongator complex protein 3 [Desulfovibrionales bacterium]